MLLHLLFFCFYFWIFFTLPYTFFPVYYQRFVLKNWCLFCLSIMGLLWIEFFLGFSISWKEVFSLSRFLVLLFGFVGISITICWFIIKRLLIEINTAKIMRMYLNKVKKDMELFKAILSNQDSIPEFKFCRNLF